MLRIVPRTVPRVGRSYEHFPDGFELHLLRHFSKGRTGVPRSKENPPPPMATVHRALGKCRKNQIEGRGGAIVYIHAVEYNPLINSQDTSPD